MKIHTSLLIEMYTPGVANGGAKHAITVKDPVKLNKARECSLRGVNPTKRLESISRLT